MPNWCDTTYYCVSDKKEDIKELVNVLKTLDIQSDIDNHGGDIYIRSVVSVLGGDYENLSLRGSVIGYDDLGDGVVMHQLTAWSELSDFREFLEFRFPGMKIYYLADEPGNGFLETNDFLGQYITARYVLEIMDDRKKIELSRDYYSSLEEVIDDLETITGLDYPKHFSRNNVDNVRNFADIIESDLSSEENKVYVNFDKIDIV